MADWRDKGWQEQMRVTFDFNHMSSTFVGEADGVAQDELGSLKGRAADIHSGLTEKRRSGMLPFFDLPYQDTAPIKDLAEELAGDFGEFVLLGIGGSALGPIALHNALNHPHYNLLSWKVRGGRPRMFFEDNVDPGRFAATMGMLDLNDTVFDVVTKSGGTAETMAAFMVARGAVANSLGEDAVKEHFVAVTDPEKGNLRKIVNDEGLRALEVPPGVGGRFSVFTPVGLLPAAASGIDIDELLAGAAFMDKRTSEEDLMKNPAYMAAAAQYLLDTKKGKHILVMMPYANGLLSVADWFRQLWAESLGKRLGLDGNVVHAGQTPVKALGATDQHSQVQLYMEGPNDKAFVFIRVEKFSDDVKIPAVYNGIEAISYLGGADMARLINAEQSATQTALMKAGRPCMRITLPELNAFTLGQLLYMFEVMTAFSGGLYDINPFDQPGVEEGKLMTYAMMGRKGYEDKKAELEGIQKGDETLVL
jgi:glucose-6-phosphate isomerase